MVAYTARVSLSPLLAALHGAPPREHERADLERCEALRARLMESDAEVGDVAEPGDAAPVRTVGAAVRTDSVPPAKARLLYRLVRLQQPARVVEFGTALGISGAVIASALAANGRGELVTLEGSPSRHEVGKASIESVAPGRTTAICGLFDDHLDALDGADLLFLDGNHWAEPTSQYVDEALRRMRRPALLLLDDVSGYSAEMDVAWQRIQQDPRFSDAGAVADVGLLAVGDVGLAPPRWVRWRMLRSRLSSMAPRRTA